MRLPDLQVIQRYSIAVRREFAPAEEVLETLRADLGALESALGSASRGAAPRAKAGAKRAKKSTRSR